MCALRRAFQSASELLQTWVSPFLREWISPLEENLGAKVTAKLECALREEVLRARQFGVPWDQTKDRGLWAWSVSSEFQVESSNEDWPDCRTLVGEPARAGSPGRILFLEARPPGACSTAIARKRRVRGCVRICGRCRGRLSSRGGGPAPWLSGHTVRCHAQIERVLPSIAGDHAVSAEPADAGIAARSRDSGHVAQRGISYRQKGWFSGRGFSLDLRDLGHYVLRGALGHGALAAVFARSRCPVSDSSAVDFAGVVSSPGQCTRGGRGSVHAFLQRTNKAKQRVSGKHL